MLMLPLICMDFPFNLFQVLSLHLHAVACGLWPVKHLQMERVLSKMKAELLLFILILFDRQFYIFF